MEIIDFRVRPRTEFFLKDVVPKVIPAYEKYVEVFHMEPRLTLTSLDESVAEMTAASITRGVIFSPNASGNQKVHEACSRFPDHYYGLAGIDITEGVTKGVADLERAYDELGLLGLSLSPFMTGIRPDDPRYYPLYALSDRQGKFVQIHSAVHFNPAVYKGDTLCYAFSYIRLCIYFSFKMNG
jgi:predicted TIM-barrel fold metal-dependent hydrolase